MIVHIVLGRAVDGLTREGSQELLDALRNLGEVPGVRAFSSGVNVSERSRGYTHGAVMQFEDAQALQGYLRDPLHLEIVGKLNSLLPDRLIVDYETGTSGISA